MVWQPEMEELERRKQLAYQMGGPESVARHRAAGKYTVRERIERLLDPGSFHERGALAGRAEYDESGNLTAFRPSNFVMGMGTIDGRPVVVGGDDFTVRGGAADGAIGGKAGHAERMARELRIPIIRLVDGTGGGGSVRSSEPGGGGRGMYIPGNPAWDIIVDAMSEIPVVGAAMGSVAGIGAARVVASHWSVMMKETSQVFVAGPPVVERGMGYAIAKEDLGGAHIHARGSGVVDNEAEDEDDAFRQIRRWLSYLPQNVWEMPPVLPTADDPDRRDEWLLSAIPRERNKVYDCRRILRAVMDQDSIFEIGRYYGRSLVTALARVDGHPVGVMINDPYHFGGGLTADASHKGARFIDFCDTFHLPIVNMVDQPGFVIGVEAEREGTIRAGSRYLFAVYQATTPWVTFIIRRAYGVAGAGHGRTQSLNLRYVWPSVDAGSLPIEGGVMAAYRREIEASPDPDARRRELEEQLNRGRSIWRMAESFNAEEIIDPRDTRPILAKWVRLAYNLEKTRLGPKSRGMRP
ncbi:MAG TPA: carboxyl transferase domain-containing protein [Dehalococcoidia bacterium]|nr:carboxyl transferase domain-containing protein [Dehalococcoidia bacterium]